MALILNSYVTLLHFIYLEYLRDGSDSQLLQSIEHIFLSKQYFNLQYKKNIHIMYPTYVESIFDPFYFHILFLYFKKI